MAKEYPPGHPLRPTTRTSPGMAVTVTLVFADESHRDAWLNRVGLLRGPRGEARWADYSRRRGNTDICYMVGPEFSRDLPGPRG